jgi:hypothetical protein
MSLPNHLSQKERKSRNGKPLFCENCKNEKKKNQQEFKLFLIIRNVTHHEDIKSITEKVFSLMNKIPILPIPAKFKEDFVLMGSFRGPFASSLVM